jgi:hypothetical protein
MSGDRISFNDISKTSPVGKSQDQDKNTFYVKELLKEKHKQLQGQLAKIKSPTQVNFMQEKINTIQKLLSYQEAKTQNKNNGIIGGSSIS